MSEDQAETVQPEESAFTASDNHSLGEMELQPWTPQRIVAGQSCGVLYPKIGDDGIEQFGKTGLYPGALKDIVLVLWLCTLDPKEVRRAERSPSEAYDKALAWADGLGILNMKSDAFWTAYSTFMGIVSDVSHSTAKPIIKDSGGTQNPNG